MDYNFFNPATNNDWWMDVSSSNGYFYRHHPYLFCHPLTLRDFNDTTDYHYGSSSLVNHLHIMDLPQSSSPTVPSNVSRSQCFQPRFSKMSFSCAHHGESMRATHTPTSCQRIIVKDEILAARKERVLLIPPDIIVEILGRLPAKHILRLRAVCKSWHSLTYEHHFISKHLKNSSIAANDLGIITLSHSQPSAVPYELSVHYYVNGFHKFDLKNLFVYLGDPRLSMSAPCDGLVCVHGREHTCVVNPSTKEALLLPKTKNKALADVALGKNISTGEYKAIRLFRRRDKSTGCEIFNLGSHSWRLIQDPPSVDTDSPHVVVNGIVHWMANMNAKWALVTFDIESESFDVIYPPTGFFRNAYTGLSELEGRLCVTVTPADSAFNNVRVRRSYKHVWILQDYENLIWKKHHISTRHLKFEVAFCMDPVMIRDGKFLFRGRSGRFIYYDPKSKRFTTPMIAVHGKDYGSAYPYKESLVSPIDIHEKNLTAAGLPLRVALNKESQGVWGRLASYI